MLNRERFWNPQNQLQIEELLSKFKCGLKTSKLNAFG